jgi:adenylate cyclase
MNYLKEHGRWIAFCMAVWCISKVLFTSIKLWGIENTTFRVFEINMGQLVSAVGFSGLIDGFIIGLVDTEFDRTFKKVSFGQRVIVKSIINLVVGTTLTIIIVPPLTGWSAEAGIALFSKKLIAGNLIIAAIYVLVITLLIQLLKVAATWIQTNDLRQIFSQDRDGIEEDRIFMFLDMKSSTTHAEKLGAGRYSMLVQDCFFDMTKAARQSKAEIYQYVGDEAVLTWKTSELNLINSVQHFFSFRKNLRSRSSHYRHQYGIVPEFKAGIHHGRVIRTQVGDIRKSIAFHGDAVNTASRIQSKCNDLGCDLLVSGVVKEGLHDHFFTRSEGTYQLKGKDCRVNLFSVKEPTTVKAAESGFARSQQNIQCKKATLPLFRLWLNIL